MQLSATPLTNGTTACKWDTVIPFDPMWERLNKLIKPNGAIVLFWSEPFSSALRMSNIKKYKYDWIWEKSRPTLFQHCNRLPLKDNECISVFNWNIYYPQWLVAKKTNVKRSSWWDTFWKNWNSSNEYISEFTNYPRRILKIWSVWKTVHPTQKPIALMEYLIKTYTNEWELVLDFTCGSWSTLVAAQNTWRRFIGIELDENYFNIWCERINNLINNK